MSVSVISPVAGLFDPYTRDKLGITELLTLALFGKAEFPSGVALATQGGAAFATEAAQRKAAKRTAKVMLAKACGRRAADFRGTFDTSDNGALASAFALSGDSGKGVTFPAATLRTITMRMVSTNNADSFYQEVEQDVWGGDGTTPVLGLARLTRAFMVDAGVYKEMGDMVAHGVVDVEDATQTSPGTALAAYSSGYALTFPPGRAGHVKSVHVSQDAYELSTSPGAGTVEAFSATAGTGNVETYVTGAGTATAVAAADLLSVEFFVSPPPQIRLALATNDVQVHINCSVNDVFRHLVEVEIGAARSNTLSA